MLNIKIEGNKVIIDVREQALRGEHPGNKVIEYIQQSPRDMVFEIHAPHEPKPLVKKLEKIGLAANIHKVDEGHYYIVAKYN